MSPVPIFRIEPSRVPVDPQAPISASLLVHTSISFREGVQLCRRPPIGRFQGGKTPDFRVPCRRCELPLLDNRIAKCIVADRELKLIAPISAAAVMVMKHLGGRWQGEREVLRPTQVPLAKEQECGQGANGNHNANGHPNRLHDTTRATKSKELHHESARMVTNGNLIYPCSFVLICGSSCICLQVLRDSVVRLIFSPSPRQSLPARACGSWGRRSTRACGPGR